MPAPPVDADPRRLDPTHHTDVACTYRWTDAVSCRSGSEHRCSRVSQDHRTHLCACDAVQLRTAIHSPVRPSRRRATAPGTTVIGGG